MVRSSPRFARTPPQCLRACPSFRQGLKAFNAVPTDANSSFVNALKRTMEGVDSSVEAIPPVQVSEAKRSEAKRVSLEEDESSPY